MLSALKRIVLSARLPNWRQVGELEDGYTIMLTTPMDIPFMLRLGLESLRHVDTNNCKHIVVVPDGMIDDGGEGLRAVVNDFDDPRIELVDLTPAEVKLIRSMRLSGSTTHWMQIVNGTKRVKTEHVFLHDSDAFFLEPGGLEAQYQEILDRELHTLGVGARWDPFFADIGYTIPGTWELMYSVRWARSHKPYEHKGRLLKTRHGQNMFDTMLYPQYLDYASGRIGVMEKPPEFVHFSGTICTYRAYLHRDGAQASDELFRLLLLSVLETALVEDESKKVMPTPAELAEGLTSDAAPVLYQSETNRKGYGEFRGMVEQMRQAPIFVGRRAEAIGESLTAFDRHFAYDPNAEYGAALDKSEMQVHALK